MLEGLLKGNILNFDVMSCNTMRNACSASQNEFNHVFCWYMSSCDTYYRCQPVWMQSIPLRLWQHWMWGNGWQRYSASTPLTKPVSCSRTKQITTIVVSLLINIHDWEHFQQPWLHIEWLTVFFPVMIIINRQ